MAFAQGKVQVYKPMCKSNIGECDWKVSRLGNLNLNDGWNVQIY